MKKILVIEDDPAILKGLEESLRTENYQVITSSDGEDGFKKAKKEKIDLILLDIMLPNKNGIDICRDLRRDKVETPILMLTSKKEEMDKVLGLEIGADDYVTKPFSIRELHARIKALLRRSTEVVSEIEEISFGKVHVDFKKHEALKNKRKAEMTVMEFKILKYFAQREGTVVTREMLLNDVWGFENYPTTRTVDNFILSLRKHIEDDSSAPKHLLTVHKAGYKFIK
ncbi:MAG: response regulator transcription factor [Ignavibacteria bacterium]|nr:response regulator transcription factor [Ignavibacteria bacterium]